MLAFKINTVVHIENKHQCPLKLYRHIPNVIISLVLINVSMAMHRVHISFKNIICGGDLRKSAVINHQFTVSIVETETRTLSINRI